MHYFFIPVGPSEEETVTFAIHRVQASLSEATLSTIIAHSVSILSHRKQRAFPEMILEQDSAHGEFQEIYSFTLRQILSWLDSPTTGWSDPLCLPEFEPSDMPMLGAQKKRLPPQDESLSVYKPDYLLLYLSRSTLKARITYFPLQHCRVFSYLGQSFHKTGIILSHLHIVFKLKIH